MERMANEHNVDILLVNRPTSTLEVMQSLKAKGLHYDAVDNLYCRGTKLSSRPLFYQRIYSAYINSLDSALPVTKV